MANHTTVYDKFFTSVVQDFPEYRCIDLHEGYAPQSIVAYARGAHSLSHPIMPNQGVLQSSLCRPHLRYLMAGFINLLKPQTLLASHWPPPFGNLLKKQPSEEGYLLGSMPHAHTTGHKITKDINPSLEITVVTTYQV